ncbi:MAG: serine--tRNA ligase [Candidatus Buchananbacteria bacterium]|nr:serine--tRNA ligase [Candidatus Buchananbacteria bacterium]
MLDINFIRDNLQELKQVTKNKGIELDYEKLLKLDDKRRELIQKIDDLRQKRNANAELLKDPQKRTNKLINEGKVLKDKLMALENDFDKVKAQFDEMMLKVPNLISEDTPVGSDESVNKVIDKKGELPEFNFKIKDHLQLGKDLNILDIDRGVKASGFRGYYLKNDGARMHLAVLMYVFNKLIAKGFTPFIPPTLVREMALIGSGHFPEGKEEVYQIGNPGKLETGEKVKESLFLAGTSEPALLAYHANEILDKKELPLKYCAFSPCYRSEVGSYGKDTRGIYRLHEFWKVEQVIICQADIKEGLKFLENLREIAEEILQDFKLPYQVVSICTGDMGAGKYKMYDLETWMPSRRAYSETHSDSFLTDWQARRLNLRYKDQKGETKYAYTLNNTALASPRILIALWENYQNKDSSITIPEVLRPYLANQQKITKK